MFYCDVCGYSEDECVCHWVFGDEDDQWNEWEDEDDQWVFGDNLEE